MTAVLDELRDDQDRRVEVTVEKLLLTPQDAAAVLSVGLTTLYELLNRGEISSISIGRARRIPLTSLRSYVAAELERGQAGVCETSATAPVSSGNGEHPTPVGAFSVATPRRAGHRRRGQ